MKKLMIGLVGAFAIVASAEVESGNIVGFQDNNVTANTRAMRSAATFLKVGGNPTEIKLSDITQTVGDPGDLIIGLYNDNVTRLAEYMFFSPEAAADAEIETGWYILADGDPDVDTGVQDANLPYGQGCVIDSASSSAQYTSAGEVDSIKREFSVTANTRKMMGNVLPRAIMLSELKQTIGDPGDLIFCTYNDNVTRTAEYMYFSEEAAADAEIESGWYILDGGDPDIDSGIQDFEIPSGQGFVVDSASSSAVLQFPKAI